VQTKEIHEKGSHEPGCPQDSATAGLGNLVCSLGAIGRALQEEFDPQYFLKEFSACVQSMLPHDRLLIAYLEDEGRTFSVFAEYSPVGPLLHEGHYTVAFDPGGRYTPEEWALRPVFAGEAMLVKDLRADPRVAGGESIALRALEAGVRSRVGVPLYGGGRTIGALLAASFTPDAYTEAHVAAARQVADLIGPFIENIVHLHQERRRRRRLEVLAGLPRVFGVSLDVKDVFARLAEATRPVLNFDVMSAGLFGPGSRDLEFLGRVDDDPRVTMPTRLPLDHFSFAPRIEAGDTVLSRDVRVDLTPHARATV